MRFDPLKKSAFILILGLLVGCSHSFEYRAGLYTKSVEGLVRTDSQSPAGEPFILVLNYHRTLIETSEGFLNRASAFVAYPDGEGKYSIPFDTDTVKLELNFYAKGYLLMNQQFHRSIGVGSYRFDVNLVEDKDWKNSYFLMIKPVLVEYITEDRFLMNQFDKYHIGQWLSEIDEEF